MADTTRYTFGFDPDCPTCHEPSEHLPEIGVWVCPYCGRLAIEYERTDDGPMLDYSLSGDDPVETIKVLGEFSTSDGLKAMLGTPYSSKDDLLALSQTSTSRRWNPNRSAWTVDANAIDEVKDHLRKAGWSVIDLVNLRRERRQRNHCS